MDWTDLPPDHLVASKQLLSCNYAQAMEGDFDPSHISFLYSSLAAFRQFEERAAGGEWVTAPSPDAEGDLTPELEHAYWAPDPRPVIMAIETENGLFSGPPGGGRGPLLLPVQPLHHAVLRRHTPGCLAAQAQSTPGTGRRRDHDGVADHLPPGAPADRAGTARAAQRPGRARGAGRVPAADRGAGIAVGAGPEPGQRLRPGSPGRAHDAVRRGPRRVGAGPRLHRGDGRHHRPHPGAPGFQRPAGHQDAAAAHPGGPRQLEAAGTEPPASGRCPGSAIPTGLPAGPPWEQASPRP